MNKALKENLKSIVRPVFFYTKSYLLIQKIYSGIGTILMFHRVCPKSEKQRIMGNSCLEVTPDYLEQCMNFFLKKNYKIVSLDTVYNILASKKKINKRFVTFTFDDGYIDNLTYAYPIFKKYNAPFAIYVTTSFPERQGILWWYLLEDTIIKNKFVKFKIGNKNIVFDCTTQKRQETTFNKIVNLILSTKHEEYLSVLKSIFESYKVDLYKKTDELALRWKDIIELSKDPIVTIGAHTSNHYVLNTLTETKVIHEVIDSKKLIESKINIPVNHFAYPFGSKNEVNEREFKIVKECGFKTAVTTRISNIFLKHREYLECLPRIEMLQERKIECLDLLISGAEFFLKNRFKKVITV